jgi:hypothetical protein
MRLRHQKFIRSVLSGEFQGVREALESPLRIKLKIKSPTPDIKVKLNTPTFNAVCLNSLGSSCDSKALITKTPSYLFNLTIPLNQLT